MGAISWKVRIFVKRLIFQNFGYIYILVRKLWIHSYGKINASIWTHFLTYVKGGSNQTVIFLLLPLWLLFTNPLSTWRLVLRKDIIYITFIECLWNTPFVLASRHHTQWTKWMRVPSSFHTIFSEKLGDREFKFGH